MSKFSFDVEVLLGQWQLQRWTVEADSFDEAYRMAVDACSGFDVKPLNKEVVESQSLFVERVMRPDAGFRLTLQLEEKDTK